MTKKQKKKFKKAGIIGSIVLCLILLVYFVMVIFFTRHLFIGTEINGIVVSGKSVQEVNDIMAAELKKYSLNLKQRGDKEEHIKAEEIGMYYNCNGDFSHVKDKQNPFKWFLAFFKAEDLKITEELAYDSAKLEDQINKLACFNEANIVEPKSPSFTFQNGEFVIVDEVYGNKINKEVFNDKVSTAIQSMKRELDLDVENCYINPQYTSKSPEVFKAKETLNKYLSAKITYNFIDGQETLDKNKINNWLIVNEDFSISVDENKVKEYVKELASKYNTVGKVKQFKTSLGGTINIGGGDYGWSINISEESKALIAAIKDGQTVSREPVYGQKGLVKASNDIGNTYVEINLSKQYLWYYKDGSLITHGPVVTGNVRAGNATPSGIYVLKYKQKDAILRGADYASPVTYWMPFNGGIGIHDASWRNTFGGEIYKTNGSHGCINCPYNLAKEIFYNISSGTPVICYH